jgi:hypothetical protein
MSRISILYFRVSTYTPLVYKLKTFRVLHWTDINKNFLEILTSKITNHLEYKGK